MQTLVIDPAVPFLVPPAEHVVLCLVGCGGTGSFLARDLARLADHCRAVGGPRISLIFLDDDRVEPKNVGRQMFAYADVGRNKAEVLAARFSAVFGLQILALPTRLTADQRLMADAPRTHYGILIGAVDTAAGRRALAGRLGTEIWRMWIDCGNHEHSGQVVVGTTTTRDALRKALALRTVCSALPAAPLVFPNLIEDPPPTPDASAADCAAAVLDNRQSLNINQMVAGVANQYLYQVLVQRALTTYRTTIDLSTLTMGSQSITAGNLERDTGVRLVQRVSHRRRKQTA